MTRSKHFDYTIIGSGGAGMSLIWAFIQTNFIEHVNLLVIEPDHKNKNDRTWCFWAKEKDSIVRDFGPICRFKWHHTEQGKQIKPLAPYSYYHLESKEFYDFMHQQMSQYDQITVVRDSVSSVSYHVSQEMIVNTEKDQFITDYVFDSRASYKTDVFSSENNPLLKQSFLGFKVVLERPNLKSEAFQMMNFDIPQNGYCQFMYVLPFSDNEALIELTRFGTTNVISEESYTFLQDWVQQKYGAFKILDIEEGAIPMDIRFNPKMKFHAEGKKHIPIGIPSGSVKCTTGYAFHNMYRYAFNLVHSLQNGTAVPTYYHSKRYVFYDVLLLAILNNRPHLGKKIFTRLFNRAQLKDILPFLDEESNLWQETKILYSLPKRIFMGSLLRQLYKKTGIWF